MSFEVKTASMSMAELLERSRKRPVKFIDGEIIAMSPTIFRHTQVIDKTRDLLTPFAAQHHLYTETTYVLPDFVRKDWVRGSRVPDVMLITDEVLEVFKALPDWQDLPLVGVPVFTAEALSPNDRHSEVVRDVNAYLKDGVKLIWVLDPIEQTVVVYAPGSEPVVLNISDTLTGGDIFPGFSVLVSAFFKE